MKAGRSSVLCQREKEDDKRKIYKAGGDTKEEKY